MVPRDATHVFDIGARVDGDHVTVLDTEVVANDTVDAGTAVIELLVGENDEYCVLPLLTPHEDGIASEKLKRVHGRLRQSDDAVVIVDGIGHPNNGVRLRKVRRGGA